MLSIRAIVTGVHYMHEHLFCIRINWNYYKYGLLFTSVFTCIYPNTYRLLFSSV